MTTNDDSATAETTVAPAAETVTAAAPDPSATVAADPVPTPVATPAEQVTTQHYMKADALRMAIDHGRDHKHGASEIVEIAEKFWQWLKKEVE